MQISLKKCPFCGGEAEFRTVCEGMGVNIPKVFCKECNANTEGLYTEHEAAEFWNKRIYEKE